MWHSWPGILALSAVATWIVFGVLMITHTLIELPEREFNYKWGEKWQTWRKRHRHSSDRERSRSRREMQRREEEDRQRRLVVRGCAAYVVKHRDLVETGMFIAAFVALLLTVTCGLAIMWVFLSRFTAISVLISTAIAIFVVLLRRHLWT